MKPFLLIFLTLSLIAHASLITHDHGLSVRRDHSQLARRAANKRCQAKKSPPSPSKSPSPSPVPTTSHQPASAPAPPPPPPGVLTVQSNHCGPSGATKEPTAAGGPNGDEDWLNCGLHSGGWTPPYIKIDQVVAMDLDQAVGTPGSPFKRCDPAFIGLFKKYAYQHGLPPIMLASFAMQESNCNPDTVGGAGEQGLMQLTKDKCEFAPGGNCRDPDYNIKTGAKYFADTLNDNGGNVLLSIGRYNGWTQGLTVGAATAAAFSSCCRCQNNLDYLQQFMNGWLQNRNVYAVSGVRIGKYFNLDICGHPN